MLQFGVCVLSYLSLRCEQGIMVVSVLASTTNLVHRFIDLARTVALPVPYHSYAAYYVHAYL